MIARQSPDLYRRMPDFIADFIDRLTDRQMSLYASDIYHLLDLSSEEQFSRALEKTLTTLQKAGIPAEHHIRPVFTDFRHRTVIDYRMSPLAFGLICMYAEPLTPRIARWRTRWIQQGMRNF